MFVLQNDAQKQKIFNTNVVTYKALQIKKTLSLIFCFYKPH